MRPGTLLLTSLALLVAAIAPANAALPPNVITAWFSEAQNVVRTFGIPNQLSARLYGTLGVAQYNALRRAPRGANLTAVAAVASHAVFDSLFPWRQGPNDLIIQSQLQGISAAQLELAKRVGVSEALRVLANRVDDGYADWSNFQPAPPNTTASIGRYQFVPGQTTALYPQLANVDPLVLSQYDVIRLTDDFHAHDINSTNYTNDLNAVYAYGSSNSPNRSQYDTQSAGFWADGANTSAIGGHWLNISWSVLPSDWELLDIARFHAQFGAAIFDASVACWQVKYTRLFWRPITAIRNGDGIHIVDPSWSPLLSTPNHPEYPSGHQCTVGAAAQVLVHALGSSNATFSIGSENAPAYGLRTYNDIWSAAVEVGNSRFYAGVHFPKSNVDGLTLGTRVANVVLRNTYRRRR